MIGNLRRDVEVAVQGRAVFQKRRQNRRKRKPEEVRRDRRAVIGSWMRRTAVVVGLGAVAVGVPLGAFYGYSHLMESEYFAVTYVDVEGLEFLDEELLLEAAGEIAGAHLLDVEPDGLAAIMADLPFVADVSVERRFPDRLHIVIEEHQPRAILVDERFWLVDGTGEVFLELDTPHPTGSLWELPLVSGLSRADLEFQEGRELLRMGLEAHRAYEARGLHQMQPISEVVVDEMLGISLIVGDLGTEVRLGKGRWEERMDRLAVVQESLNQRRIDPSYILIDHDRELNRVAVGQRRKPGNGEDEAVP